MPSGNTRLKGFGSVSRAFMHGVTTITTTTTTHVIKLTTIGSDAIWKYTFKRIWVSKSCFYAGSNNNNNNNNNTCNENTHTHLNLSQEGRKCCI